MEAMKTSPTNPSRYAALIDASRMKLRRAHHPMLPPRNSRDPRIRASVEFLSHNESKSTGRGISPP